MQMRKFVLSIAWVTLLVALSGSGTAVAEGGKPTENAVKSAMIFNMIKFVDWPAEALANDAGTITVCVLGKGGLAGALDALQGEQLKGRKVVVRQIKQVADTGNCQVLVIGDVERRIVTTVIEQTRQLPLLTISDLPNFAQAGGVVGLGEQSGKIRFVINLSASAQHKVRIHSLLLKMARIVQDSQ